MNRPNILTKIGTFLKRAKGITALLSVGGILLLSPIAVFPASSANITITVAVRTQIYLHDGTTLNTLEPLQQFTDGSGKVYIYFRIKHSGGLPCDVVPGSFEYQVDGGGWLPINDADITGQKSNLASATDMSGPQHLLIWDTSKEYIDNAYSHNVQIRFKITDGAYTSEYGISPLGFDVDNLAPQGMADFGGYPRRSKIECYWTPVSTENNWASTAHYEIWYGTNQADVESRSGTAQEWDSSDDPALSTMATNHTTITGLNPLTTYYVKIWAVDDFGNEVSLPASAQQVDTLGDGTLAVALGDNSPPDRFVPFNGHNVSMFQLKLTVGAAENINVTSITFHAAGTGDDVAHILPGGVRLYNDVNGNGKLDVSDVQIGTAQVFNADNGSVTFSGFSETLNYGSYEGGGDGTATYNWLVVYDYAGVEASKQKTFQTIFQQASDITATGEESGSNIVPTGTFPINGGIATLVETGVVQAELGENNPPAEDIMNNLTYKEMLQIKLTETTGYEDVLVKSITITASGTGDDTADISSIEFFWDENGNGVYDTGDTDLGSAVYNADDGTATITFNPLNRYIPAGSTKYLLITYNYNGTASAGDTFRASLVNNVDIELLGGTSNADFSPQGTFPLDGNYKTIVAGKLQASLGPATPFDSYITNDTLNEVMMQLRIAETTGLEDVRLNSLTLTAQGTGDDVANISGVRLYFDMNSNGMLDDEDWHLGTGTFNADDGTVTFNFTSRTIPAGGYKDFLVIYDFNGTAVGGATFQVSVNADSDINATGITSGQQLTVEGAFPIDGAVKTISSSPSGRLYISLGEHNPSSGNIRADHTDVVMMQYSLEADNAEDIKVSSATLHHGGTGDTSGISNVRIYRDVNADGKLDGGDVLIGQSSTWTGGENTVTFTAPEIISSSSKTYFIVVYDFNGTASVGDTFYCYFANNTDIYAEGVTSLVRIAPSGNYPVQGATKTVADKGTLTVSEGENNPSSGNVLKDQSDVVMEQIRFDTDLVEGINISSITLTHTGTGNPSEDVSNVRLYADINGDGNLDGGDVLLAQGTFPAGSTQITLSPNRTIAADSTEYWIVVYDFSGTASEMETFTVSVNSASDITAIGGWSSQNVTIAGAFPVSGPEKSIVPERAHVSVSLSPLSPPDTNMLNVASFQPVIVVDLQEISGYEDVWLKSITFHSQGTGNEYEDIGDVNLFWDENGNGVYDNGVDTNLATSHFNADDGTITFDLTGGAVRYIPKGTTKHLLLTYDFNGNADKGDTFQALVNASTDIVLEGLTTGMAIPAEGTFPITGGTITIVTGEVSITAGEHNPADKSVCNNVEYEPVLQLKLTETTGYEDVYISQITIHGSGTGNEYEDVEYVSFFFDENNNGVYDAGVDTHMGNANFNADDGTATLTLPTWRLIPAGSTKYILVTYTLRGTAQINETFKASLAQGADVVMQGRSSGKGIVPTGSFPIDGATLTIATDPSGKVYNALTGEPVAGAIVELWSPGADGRKGTADDVLVATNAPGGTAADGLYSFIVANGDYYLKVTNASSLGYTFPSEVIPLGSPHAGSHGEIFTQTGPTTVDLPLDPDDTKVIKLTKDANKDEVVVGDIVTYTLTIESKYDKNITLPLYVEDKLPPGFKYISGTAQLDGQPIADPTGTSTRRFNIGTLDAGQTKSLSYQLVVGSGVVPGNYYTNRARVISSAGTPLSNDATERVKVTYDPIFDLCIVLGKVFNDKNGDGVQERGEEGIPDVKIATEDGLYVVTDKDGKYHIDGIKPQTKLLKVDVTTLPEGAEFTTENPRVVHLTPGLLAKVNFGVKLAEPLLKHRHIKGKPYLEIKVDSGILKVDPQLTVYHTPDIPQLNLKGDALETDITFQINTNYPDFIDKWKLEIYSLDNRVVPIRVFEGTRKDLFDPIVWDGRDDKGRISDPDTTYIYVLTVEDKDGHQDKTIDKQLTISAKRTVAKEEKPNVLSEEFYSNAISVQTIPVDRKGITVRIKGITDKQARVIIDDQDLGTVDSGEFSKELILPPDKKSIRIEARKDGKSTVYEKKLSLKQNYFFLVALGDAEFGKMKASGNIEPVRDNDKFRSGWYFDGRLAFYLKAKVKGKYLITSSYDSSRRKNELARFIDPDKYYPVYGDTSTVVDDTNTQGRFYILVEWDKSYLTWGNYSTDINDVDLAAYTRTLYGGKLHYQSVSTTKYGDPDTIFIVFGAETNQRPAHNEFLSTGGSLYYLKHTDIVEGSENVTIEVRDKDTGLVTSSYTAQRDVDYEIDYDQGRITFYKPVSMIAASEDLISDAVLLGNPIYVVVDYEYESSDFLDEGTYGVRFAHQLNDHIKIGTTYIKDERNSGYELRGYDLTVKLKESTEFKIEYAESKSANTANFISYDGGLTFDTLPSDESSKGNALKVDLKTDLGELFNKKTNKLLLEFYYQDISSGFSSQAGISQQGTEKYGVKLTANLTDKDTVTLTYDHSALKAAENIEASNTAGSTKSDEYTLQYKHTENKYTITGEYKYANNQGVSTTSEEEEGKSHTVAGKIEYNVNDKTKVYAQQQVTLKGKSDNRTILGAIIEFTNRLKVKLEQMVGNRGNATEIGIDSWINSKTRMYTTYSFGREKGEGRTSTTTVGTETLMDKDTKLYTEQEYKLTDNSRSTSRIIGLDYTKDQWDISARLERGEVVNQGEKTKRTTISLGTGFTEPDKLKFSAKLEFRFDRGGSDDKDQYVFDNSIEYKLNPDWTLFTRLDYSRTHNRTTGKTEAEYKEFVFGGAFRPVDFDKLNLLTKLSYIEDKEPTSQEDTASISEERGFVFAIEGAYDLTKHLQLVKKFAIKRGEERVGSRDFTKTQTYLWISRFNYHITSRWDIGLEYRTLAQKQAQDAKRGFLVEVTRHLNKNFQVGVGYNFTDFSDDLTETDDYTVKGFFFRITGKY